MSVERATELAKQMSAILAGEELPTAATALIEVTAILIVWLADEDKPKRLIAKRLFKQALMMAEAIPLDALLAMDEAEQKREADRKAELLKAAGPKRASPWGEPR